MRVSKPAWIGTALLALLFLATPTIAQEVIVSVRPGVKSVPVYDTPGGRKIADLPDYTIQYSPVRSKSGEWVEITNVGWVPAGDVIVRAAPRASGPKDSSYGATRGTQAPR